jgi:hypothetical protein
MNEAAIRLEVGHLLRRLGYIDITQTDATKCPKCGTFFHPPKGRPDILCLHTTAPSVVCEVKIIRLGESSFPFDRINQDQRDWLSRWSSQTVSVVDDEAVVKEPGTGYLAIGTVVPRARRLWLVEWRRWLEIEEIIRPYQNSIPVEAGKGMRRELQDNQWDLTHLAEEWEASWGNGRWEAPPNIAQEVQCVFP